MDYTYYLVNSILFILWLIIFIFRKDLRKEMLILGILFGIGGLLSELIYVRDWWAPPTIGPWDFLFGFFIAGISASFYLFLFNRKLKKNRKLNKPIKTRYILILFLILFFGGFYILGSFYSSLLAYMIITPLFLFYRRDLIKYSLISGLLMLIVGILSYFIFLQVYPNFIKDFWYLSNSWYTKLILGLPLEEYIWYFLTGAFISCIFKYSKKEEVR